MLCSLTQPTKVPYFNAPIYLQNKTQIGKIDEILGPINEVYFTVKMEQGMLASSFKKDDKVYIGGDKLLPIERFLPKPKVPGGEAKSESPYFRKASMWAGRIAGRRTTMGGVHGHADRVGRVLHCTHLLSVRSIWGDSHQGAILLACAPAYISTNRGRK